MSATNTVVWYPLLNSFLSRETWPHEWLSQYGAYVLHFGLSTLGNCDCKIIKQINFTSCHPQGVKRGFIKGKAIRLLRTNSLRATFDDCLANFKWCFKPCGYPKKFIESSLSAVTNYLRQSALKPQKHNTAERLLFFCQNIPPCGKETY